MYHLSNTDLIPATADTRNWIQAASQQLIKCRGLDPAWQFFFPGAIFPGSMINPKELASSMFTGITDGGILRIFEMSRILSLYWVKI